VVGRGATARQAESTWWPEDHKEGGKSIPSAPALRATRRQVVKLSAMIETEDGRDRGLRLQHRPAKNVRFDHPQIRQPGLTAKVWEIGTAFGSFA